MISPTNTPDVTQASVQQMISDAVGSAAQPLVIDLVPTEGQTITVPNTTVKEIFLNLAPAADLTNVTINLPSNTTALAGQRCFIGSTRQIANCTVTSSLTVYNGSLMFSPGDNAAFVRNNNAPHTWSRVLVS